MRVILGLTTIFERQKQCARTLRSLLEQTQLPDEIWLFVSSKPHLLDKGIQPYCLDPTLYAVTEKDKRIRVEWIENQGPYRKLLPLLKKYWQQPDICLLTCDDDIVYKKTFVEEAIRLYKEKHCCIGFMGTTIQNTFEYTRFPDAKGTQCLWNLAKGCAGIVYSPMWFTNEAIFQYKDFPTCDDLWFAAWRIAANVECYIAETIQTETSLASGAKGNLWTQFNEAKNTELLEKILTLFVYRGWIQGESLSFFNETSHILFQWNNFLQTHILPLVGEEDLEGNIWSKNHTKVPDINLLPKQKNILWLAKQIKGTSLAEIGVNAGFSVLLFLLSNPNLHIVGFDLGEHAYAHAAYSVLKNHFGDRIQVLFGDSQETLKTLAPQSFECIHVDGGHSEEVATSDVQNSARILQPNGLLLVDDTNLGSVMKAIGSEPRLKEQKLPFVSSIYTHKLYMLVEIP